MKFQLLLFLTSASITGVISKDNITIGDLPKGIASQLLSLLTNASIKLTGGCGPLEADNVELLLYTRSNREKPINLNCTIPVEIDPNKKIIILIHGWISSFATFVPEMTDPYLDRYDCNLIMVNWNKLALKFYPTAVCYVPKIAEFVANFLCRLSETEGVLMDEVHLVGHSLGGQMSGYIGQYTKSACNRNIGRITAMDPAGPLYHGLPKSERLDKADANFVDVIHTNGAVLGYLLPCGDADFFINCGTLQIGCPQLLFQLDSIKDLPVPLVTCHHSRSIEYMAESVANLESFPAKSCQNCPLLCIASILLNDAEYFMGEGLDIKSASGSYAVLTNLESPYGTDTLENLNRINAISSRILLPRVC